MQLSEGGFVWLIIGGSIGYVLCSYLRRDRLTFREWHLAAFMWEVWKKKQKQHTLPEWKILSEGQGYTPKEIKNAYRMIIQKDPFYKTKEDVMKNGK